jgi:hypothetical protein
VSFAIAFPTGPKEINYLVLTVDREVGGSNPPSCTSRIKDFFWPTKIQGSFGVTLAVTATGEIVAARVLAFVRLVPLDASQKTPSARGWKDRPARFWGAYPSALRSRPWKDADHCRQTNGG